MVVERRKRRRQGGGDGGEGGLEGAVRYEDRVPAYERVEGCGEEEGLPAYEEVWVR